MIVRENLLLLCCCVGIGNDKDKVESSGEVIAINSELPSLTPFIFGFIKISLISLGLLVRTINSISKPKNLYSDIGFLSSSFNFCRFSFNP